MPKLAFEDLFVEMLGHYLAEPIFLLSLQP